MTYPIAKVENAFHPSFAKIVEPVDGVVQITTDISADDTSTEIYAVLPKGEKIGEELTVIYENCQMGGTDYARLYLGIHGRGSPFLDPNDNVQFHRFIRSEMNGSTNVGLPGGGAFRWAVFYPSPLGTGTLFLRWTTQGWMVIGSTLDVQFEEVL